MDFGLEGKVALVAGASRGLGFAVARGLLDERARVAICARGREGLDAAVGRLRRVTGGEVWARPTDLSDAEEARAFVREAAAHYGAVDILVNNAGGPPSTTFLEAEEDAWRKGIDLNLMSTVVMTREAVPHMQKKRWGRVVNMTSVAVKQPIDGLILSNTARAAVIGLAKTLATELAPHGILVNNVCPGYTRTERVETLSRTLAEKRGTTPEAVVQGWEKSIPLGRLGKPEELAALVVFLCSERASYVTGTTIQVDGGYCRSLL